MIFTSSPQIFQVTRPQLEEEQDVLVKEEFVDEPLADPSGMQSVSWYLGAQSLK